MPGADVFRKLGLFVVDDFFSTTECVALRAAAETAPRADATVLRNDRSETPHYDRRRTGRALLSQSHDEVVLARINALTTTLANAFDISLGQCQPPQFLVYAEGDFFGPHRDRAVDVLTPKEHRERALTAVIFLNDSSRTPSPGCYVGGELVFYGLIDKPMFEHCALPFQPRLGTLVVFPSSVVHEVRAITSGTRYTVVTWITEADART